MRFCLCLVVLAALCSAADPAQSDTVRGKLLIREGQPASVQTAEGRKVELAGDDSTQKVLADPRLNGFEIQAKGRFDSPAHFTIDPIHTHSLLVNQSGRLKLVTYWCDVCTIRSYTPGPCVCCQKETTLDLIDPDHETHK